MSHLIKVNLAVLLVIQLISLAHAQSYNSKLAPRRYNQGAGYAAAYDSRYFKHGSRENELNGGTCSQFLALNSLGQCCASRDDDCYMIHYDTRCYCDVFCDRSKVPDNSDCCPDAEYTCNGRYEPLPVPTTTPEPVPTEPAYEDCYVNGNYYRNGESFQDNCKECTCINGRTSCTSEECLINVDLLNQINDEQLSWTASNYSAFWGKTLEHGYRHRLGTKLPIREQRALSADDKPIRESYDFRNEDFIARSPRRDHIRDQGDCAASWAFSTVDVATDRLAKVYEGARGNESMSVQQVISCAILPGNANGCSPASVDIAWKFLENSNKDADGKIQKGLVNERCYPYESGYTGSAGECKANINSMRVICPSDNRPYTKTFLNSAPGYPINYESQNEIMEEIISNGPVQFIFKVFNDFFMYKSGIYSKHPNARLANIDEPYHSVKVLGWGSENGVDYWIAANSWGEQWGENGYFRIKREDEETEFGRHIYASWGSKQINTKNKNTMFRKRNRNIQRKE